MSVRPIKGIVDDKPSLFVYTKVATAEARTEKQKIAQLMGEVNTEQSTALNIVVTSGQ